MRASGVRLQISSLENSRMKSRKDILWASRQGLRPGHGWGTQAALDLAVAVFTRWKEAMGTMPKPLLRAVS